MERNSSKEYPVVFLVVGKKFKLRNFFPRSSSLLCSRLRTRSVQPLTLQHLATDLTPNIGELGRSGFFCLQPCFLRQSKHIFPGKALRVYLDRAAIKKQSYKY